MQDDIKNPTSDEIDAFLGSENPQSEAQSKGFSQIAEVSAVKQALDFGGNLDRYQETLNNAIAGDESAQQEIANRAANVAMGSIQLSGPKAKPIFTSEEALSASKAVKPAVTANYGKVTNDIRQAGKPNYGKVIVKDIPKGDMYADGGSVKAPEGLDAFLSNNNAAPSIEQPNSAEPSDAPPGLDEFLAPELKEAKYGTLGQQAKTVAEGAAKGLFGPLATAAEVAAGVDPEDIRNRQEVNPVESYGSEAAGLVAPLFATAGSNLAARAGLEGVAKYIPKLSNFTQAGALEGVTAKLGLVAGPTLASKIGTTAARAAVDNMLLAGSDEVSKVILKDPNQSAQTALVNVGLAGALGGILGAGIGAAQPLWSATVGSKVGKLVEDFKGRINEHIANPDPVNAMTNELDQYYNNVKSMADEVYGVKGLKQQDIAKTMPEMHSGITEQVDKIHGDVSSLVNDMADKPMVYPERLTNKLQNDVDMFTKAITDPERTPESVFNAMQDLKQQVQAYSKFDKFVKPTDEAYDFVKDAKQLSYNLRTALEDESVWKNAAKRQTQINAAFKEYLPALQDFEKRFTTKVGGEPQIDPAKVNTYLNQLGKPNAEIKQKMLQNFLDASDAYKNVIAKTHSNLGLEVPHLESPMNVTRSSLGQKTLGSKLADAFIEKGLTDAGGKAIGASIGAGLGHALGVHGALGAIIGAHALGPFFSSVLPSIAKSVIGKEASTAGFKAAADYSFQVAKGTQLMAKAATNIFKDGEVLPQNIKPSEKDREKLNNILKKLQTNPEPLFQSKSGVELNHYMPEHHVAMDETVGNAVSFLNSLRSDLDKKAPLDSTPVQSSTQKAQFENALNLAEQPLMLFDKLKKGNMTGDDIKLVQTLYPNLYSAMQQQAFVAINDTLAKGKTIPYATRIGLSMLLAQPLDSTMSPSAIQAIQMPMSASNQQPQTAEQASVSAPKRSPSSGVKSAPALQKLPTMYQTPGQSREANRNKR